MNYETRKNLWLVGIAFIFAAIAATLATQWMKARTAEADATRKTLASVVVAARDIPMGKRIDAADLRIVRISTEGVPSDVFHRNQDVLGQVSRSPFYAGEALIARRLTKYFGGSALAAVVEPDMRAVTVRVDDVIAVGGFVLPENRVDVISAFSDAAGPRAETILRDVRVLAVDQRSTPESDAPVLSRAVTLEVTPQGAELIAAAKHRGTIQLTLRNPTSHALPDSLDVENLDKPAPVIITAGMPGVAAASRAPSPPRRSVTVIRGTVVATRTPE